MALEYTDQRIAIRGCNVRYHAEEEDQIGWHARGSAARPGRSPILPPVTFGTDAPGMGNSPDPCRAVAGAGLLPKRGREAPHIGSLRRCLPVTRAGNPVRTNCASFWQPESMWPWRRHRLSLRVQTLRATDQDEITYTPALLRPPLNHCQPVAQGFCGLTGLSLAGRQAQPCWRPLSWSGAG